jgi:hypothetical protein
MATPPQKPSVYDVYEAPFSLYDPRVGAAQGVAPAMQRSTHLQETETSRLFFGRPNIDALQGRLVRAIRERTGYTIDRQSEEQLLIVMRYVYMQSGRHHGGAREVARLNELVLREVVPQVGAGLAQYLDYLRDASTMYTPIARGQATSIKGTKSLEVFRGL